MVDAPLDPKPKPRPASGPIRVQVSENGEAGPPKPKPPEVRPEDMGALLDAFGPAEPAGKPAMSPLEAAAAEESVDADAELSGLNAEPPPAAPPAAPEPPTATARPKQQSPLENAAAEDVSGLLDALGGSEEAPIPAPDVDTSQTLIPGRIMSPFAEPAPK